MTISGNFELFWYFNFETDFVENKNIFKKIEYLFLIESTKIENTYPYKTAILEANVKTNRMVSTKWIYHKERSFASNYFIFLIFFFSLRTSYKELIWYTSYPNVHIPTLCKRWSFIRRCLFPVSILEINGFKVLIQIAFPIIPLCSLLMGFEHFIFDKGDNWRVVDIWNG